MLYQLREAGVSETEQPTTSEPPRSIQEIQAQDFAAWRLIGRLDMAFEQMAAMTNIQSAQRLARRMRKEIQAALEVSR